MGIMDEVMLEVNDGSKGVHEARVALPNEYMGETRSHNVCLINGLIYMADLSSI
jgi:hypothetical protein